MLESLRFAMQDTWVITKRNLVKYPRVPQLLVLSIVQPVMILLLFNYVFGGAIRLPEGTGDYINYLLPGVLVQVVLFGVIQASIAIADDLNAGIITRLRSLPMSRIAVVAGRAAADLIRNMVVLTVMVGVGYLIGFRLGGSVSDGLIAFALMLLFGFAVSWISIAIGLLVKESETAMAAGFVWVFPLVFASSIFVPVATMPTWLQGFAENQPVSLIATAVRSLVLETPNEGLLAPVAWSLAIFIVFAAVCTKLYSRKAH